MNVDTGAFRALTAKVDRLNELVGDEMHVLLAVTARLIEDAGLVAPEPAEPAAPEPRGHLRVIRGGGQ